jgi:ABC-type Na+ transport system ATPase subunit NatA
MVTEVDGLPKFHGTHSAVDDVGFTVSEGEILGIVGISGAGKTTTVGRSLRSARSFFCISHGASRRGSRDAIWRMPGRVSRPFDDRHTFPAGRQVHGRGSR